MAEISARARAHFGDKRVATDRLRQIVECRRCGAQHGFDEWVRLKALGLQEQGELLGEPLELRNCECGSTLAMPLRRLPL